MGLTVDDILASARRGSTVHMSIVSNEEDGIASYASGGLIFEPASGGVVLDGPPLKPARLATPPGEPIKYHFSDRRLNIDPPPAAGAFGATPRQPFNANATEPLAVSLTLASTATVPVRMSFFGSTSTLEMERRGKLLVGLGPSLGPSEGGIYVIAFTGLTHPPG